MAPGLFDEISIESFGRTDDATPFQIQIRKFGGKLKGNRRNLIDVGYGVSQALPIVTELLRSDAPRMFLLQQPEVHLHLSAQAALGSLFCSIAGPERQLVVETHSDYIIDRVRMDVRDKKTELRPEDVSILYFERGESDVKIHSHQTGRRRKRAGPRQIAMDSSSWKRLGGPSACRCVRSSTLTSDMRCSAPVSRKLVNSYSVG